LVIKSFSIFFQSVELLHAYITPYTVKKNLKTVKPISKASDLKTILSRNPMKKVIRIKIKTNFSK
jgi:hypothetical protein